MKKIFPLCVAALLLAACEPQNPIPSPTPYIPQESAVATEPPTNISSAEPSAEPSPEPTEMPTPEPTEAPPQKKLIGKASTPLLDKDENRLKNIHRAAEQISGITIDAGETFSFNAIVGERSAETGYEIAPVILYGEKKNDYGGGVCQLATTIFQAAEDAGLKITERHNHQKDIGYAEHGRDAAVNYGSLDMKFVNNTDFPILIALLIGKNTVNAEIYRVNY